MIGILGAGAFGTALAVTLGREQPVTLWARGGTPRLAVDLPEQVQLTADFGEALAGTVLLAVPMQALGGLLRAEAARLQGRALVACCKGVDLATGLGPTGLIAEACPGSPAAILTGPSFAADIARGLPTALTLATQDEAAGEALQRQLSTAALRLYRTTDTVGAELGGALKNVIAIAAGVVIGAGLGQSARAALMTRGYAEMQRLALALGARPETLAGLSGLGDLVLTCTSDQSRNFRYGQALGAGAAFDGSVTVEGRATARAVVDLAVRHGIDMPIAAMVDALVDGRVTLPQAIQSLLSRPLKQE
ncbi:glycerol-3-phosphate dehydrogenase (NAD(P)+) [[Luteovulum] sphaeroides subsp. megalophilum]|uniref:NAD(P)H-dependent glycerol-3-phosphate dehydrogenase n=1 Tax=Cereibacter sphaeroides TaxID=1063 RepID=UPI000B6C635B|nr:NAD(P)H-dependent glycerol-3-phosphate dehydrogenase [Cereibacter sphaeroides]SNT32404.1 glycerol-3-phosphate dehydrogenase (NAD(P)+) [[Luteovulum] sphaeroides subsp. megalophilum]